MSPFLEYTGEETNSVHEGSVHTYGVGSMLVFRDEESTNQISLNDGHLLMSEDGCTQECVQLKSNEWGKQ